VGVNMQFALSLNNLQK